MSRLRYLLGLTPLETWRIARRRLPLLRNGPAWYASELLSSAWYSRGIRFAELLDRQQAIVRRHMAWKQLDFEGRRIIEVGCGPLAGFGPLAVFCGARSFESAEPEWDAALFHGEEIANGYLRKFHADLVALYGPRMDFKKFRQRLHDRLTIHTQPFEIASISGLADVVLSQSCLEHVFPLEATLLKLASIQSPSTRFLHHVDFGNHYPTINPFEGLYDQPPRDYLARRGEAINLLRAPDVLAQFKAQGIPAALVVQRVIEHDSARVHPWWRERYDKPALDTEHALIAGPATQ
jgi:hypothetical protein